MEQNPNIPEELKKYDTPENRQAYQSYVAQTRAAAEPQLDHGTIPQELWQYDTAAARKQYTSMKLSKQMNDGLMTSDNRLLMLTPDQVSWVSRQYQKSWDYGHDVADQQAKAAGVLPPSMYSKYKQKSA